MSDAGDKKSKVRRQRSIQQVHYNIRRREETPRPLIMPGPEVQAYGRQVAGHRDSQDTKYLGLLQCSNGRVLKPIIKEAQKREIDFYERISSATEPDLVELRECVPKYYGCTKFTYNGHTQEYIIMEDLTLRMLEPCIMDVKIGKRTWDPLASEEKKLNEQSKYALCKQQYGFCIPGFQVYKAETGRLCRYNKDFGKKLHGQAVKDAVRTFLNGGGGALCRALVLQLLAGLWRVQRWARRGARVTLCSASLLLAYDAAALRTCCRGGAHRPRVKCRPAAIVRRRSIHTLPSEMGSNFSGELTARGPHYRKLQSVPLTPLPLARAVFSPPPTTPSPWSSALERLTHNHSFDHNYDHKLSDIKMNYRALLDRLASDEPTPQPRATVKIIDFAHAFFDDDNESIDENFKEGVDSFVEIIESFLRETEEEIVL